MADKKTSVKKKSSAAKSKSTKPAAKKKTKKVNLTTVARKTRKQTPVPAPDPSTVWQNYDGLAKYMTDIGGKGQEILEDYISQHTEKTRAKASEPADPLGVTDTMQDVFASVFSNPYNIMRMQFGMWEDYARLADTMSKQALGQEVEHVVEPTVGDRRFSHEAWNENPALNYVMQSYLIMSKWARNMVERAEDLDEHTRKKAMFYTEQFLAAMAPTNFPNTNPEVIEETMRSNGENFLRGFKNLLEDMERGHGELQMKQADLDFFKVGENIATTPGKVVFENDLLQLIQYSPTTEEVAKRPLLIFPPWINKFYILDLQPENSLISWLVDQGRTVFVVSWVNPGIQHADKTFDDYVFEGVFESLEAIEKATGEKEVDTIGYCIGGTMLAVTLAYMAEIGDERIKSATFFTAQMDFKEAGELLLFVDEEQITNIEKQIDAAGGIFSAASMSRTFNMLRPVDLIWSVYVDNYLKGKEPKRFDLLYWNSDATAMSKHVYLFYLKEFYQKNNFSRGKLKLDGKKLDLGKVSIPIFMQAGEKDHIAPFRSIYRSAKLFGGPVEFMLAGSGHIAGVINHPSKKKYHYSTNTALPDRVESWISKAERHDYSWWPYWIKWLEQQSEGTVPARIPGDGKLKVIEDAPGSYVKIKAAV